MLGVQMLFMVKSQDIEDIFTNSWESSNLTFSSLIFGSSISNSFNISTFIGILLTFSSMHFLGFNVMPRRIPNFPDSFHFWNFLSSIGSGITFLSFAMFSYKDCLQFDFFFIIHFITAGK